MRIFPLTLFDGPVGETGAPSNNQDWRGRASVPFNTSNTANLHPLLLARIRTGYQQLDQRNSDSLRPWVRLITSPESVDSSARAA